MKYLNGILVVEGNNDASYISSFIKCEIVVVNGYELENLDYLKEASKIKQIFVLTDPDEAGRTISKRIIKELENAIDICVDIAKCNNKSKRGIAECEKEEILCKLQKFLKNTCDLQEKRIKASDVWMLKNKEKLANDFHLGNCNTKKLVERLNTLNVPLEKLNDYK